jgi:type IV secretion system protein TrbC
LRRWLGPKTTHNIFVVKPSILCAQIQESGEGVLINQSVLRFGHLLIALRSASNSLSGSPILPLLFGLALSTTPVFAQASPWENAVTHLQTSFTGPIARGLSLVAIVIGGLMFAYSEGAAKKTFAGILFGCGAALAANNFMTWLFP